MYDIIIPDNIRKEFSFYKKKDKPKCEGIRKAIKKIQEEPKIYGKPLSNRGGSIWETHVGSYVLFYSVKDNTITIHDFKYHPERKSRFSLRFLVILMLTDVTLKYYKNQY
jgi:mRNA-degrading endonuclease RelE of RelBE toxin-antitoxin system